MVVRDVEEFPGHIACDADSRSEIVVPLMVGGEVCVIALCLSVGCGCCTDVD